MEQFEELSWHLSGVNEESYDQSWRLRFKAGVLTTTLLIIIKKLV
jgi:hypothetical protein